MMISEAAIIAWLEAKRAALDGRLCRNRIGEEARADRKQMLTAMIGEVEAGLLREVEP